MLILNVKLNCIWYFIKDYKEKITKTNYCNPALASSQSNCKFDVFQYLNDINCKPENNYGFSDGNPCIFVKINNVKLNYISYL